MVLQEEMEKVQNRAVKLVTSNYCFETRSINGILEKLRWESLKKRTNLFVQRSKGYCHHSNR